MSDINPTYKTVLRRLRAVRQAKGLTLKQASILTDISIAALGSWEREHRKATLENILYLCNRYNISIELLLRPEEPIQMLMKMYHKQLTEEHELVG